MHIAYFSPNFAANGITTYVDCMRRILTARGHLVSVVTVEDLDCGWAEGMADRLFKMPLSLGRRVTRVLRSIERRNPIDLFEMEETYGWARHAFRDFPTLIRLHGPHEAARAAGVRGARSRFQARMEHQAIAQARALSAPTASVMSFMGDYGDLPADRQVIPNPVEIPAARWKQNGSTNILFVGRFDRAKGADVAVRAFAMVLDKMPTATMTIVGPDRTLEGVSAEEYLKDHPRVTFAGLQSAEAIRRLRDEAGVAVISSRHETFGYVAAESMAYGMPTVSTVLVGHETGWPVDAGDARGLSVAILDALTDRGKAESMGSRARAYCSANFAPEVVGDAMIELYERLTARH